MKKISFVATLLLMILVVSSPLTAQGLRLPFGNSKSAEPADQTLDLSEKGGPWLVMCTSFVGDDGLQQARRLAQELREQHRLNAYVYRHEFDFTKDVENKGSGWEVFETQDHEQALRPIRMKANSKTKFEEVAVLVGDFASVDDPQAQKTLERIKNLRLESLAAVEHGMGESMPGQGMRASGFASESNSVGPLRAAFMLPNPLLPDEYFSARNIDMFVLNMNKSIKNSLLDNPGIYSVKVATFNGEITLDLEKIAQKSQEDEWRKRNRQAITESKLVDAAKKATVLSRELRKQGYDAYEFHDRHESYVCVGSFDWIVQEDALGNKRQNPEVVKTILEFKGARNPVPGKPGAVTTFKLPNKLVDSGVVCDPQPLPVLIPKAPEEARSAKRFLGRFR